MEIPKTPVGLPKYSPNTIIASTVSPGYNSTNATTCFVNAIKSAKQGDTVVIDNKWGSNGGWNIEGRYPNWFDGKSGRDRVADGLTLIFEKGVTLKAIDSTYDDNSGLDMLFRLENISGWKIFGYGAKFEMDNTALPDGEHRNSIALYNCKDILIEGLQVNGSGGDGIYVGTRTPTGFSENIVVRNMDFENHRRQGATITSAHNVLFQNVKFNRTRGKPPTSGVDLEPDDLKHILTDIKFKNVEFAENGYSGILFALSKLNATSTPVKVDFDEVYIIDNWREKGKLDPKYKKGAIVMGIGGGGDDALQGAVTFSNVLIENERFDGIYTVKHHDSYKLVFNDLVIQNVGAANAENARHAIHTSRYNYDLNTPAMGNIIFNGLLVREDRNVPFWQMGGDSDDGWSIDDVTIENALIVSPRVHGQAMNNTTNASKGAGTNMQYSTAAIMPKTILTIKKNTSKVVRGSKANSYFTVTRIAEALNYPLPVEYTVSGTADNMDDYDLLHGYVIIPANKSSVKIPINARAKCDDDETLTVTLINTRNYNLDNIVSQTVNIVTDN